MTKATVSMQEFLRTGDFGPVSLGISRSQLQGFFGDPEHWGPYPRAKHNAGIWKYGDIEFHFDNSCTLSLIFADHVEMLRGGEAFDLDPWIFNGRLLVAETLDSLSTANIAFERIPWTLDDDTERYRVGVGIKLLFLNEMQHLFCDEGISPLAQPGMTFDGFSYSRQNEVKNGDGTAGKTGH